MGAGLGSMWKKSVGQSLYLTACCSWLIHNPIQPPAHMKNVEHYTLAHIIINIHHIFNTVLELLLLTLSQSLRFTSLMCMCK
jgi:hypothetical protein